MITEQITPFPLRMAAAMRKQLEEEAERNVRSLNSEILHRLVQGLKEDGAKERSLNSSDVNHNDKEFTP